MLLFGPSHPLNRKMNLTYCFTTRFPTSRADWKEQKLGKDNLKTVQFYQLSAFLFPNDTENRTYINDNISRPPNTWLLLAYWLATRNFSPGAYQQIAIFQFSQSCLVTFITEEIKLSVPLVNLESLGIWWIERSGYSKIPQMYILLSLSSVPCSIWSWCHGSLFVLAPWPRH